MKQYIPIYHWWPSALTLLLVLWLTLAREPLPDTHIELFAGADKLVHAIMMGGLTGAILFDYTRLKACKFLKILSLPVACVVIGMVIFSALDEWAQYAMGMGRSADIFDFIADIVGILIASMIAPPVINKVLKKCENGKDR